MTQPKWQLQTPLDAIAFDCDGTLTTIEGIDELALQSGNAEEVAALTHEAMSKTGINPELYQARLNIVRPPLEQAIALSQTYFAHIVPDVNEVIQLFLRLNKPVYVLSAGLYPSVALFAELLQIPRENIIAVAVEFDKQGQYVDFDHHSPLVTPLGKRDILQTLQQRHPRMMYVGDGINDLVAHDVVTRFVGYGGVYYRQNIAEKCDFYIKSRSLLPVLPLSLTAEESNTLLPHEKTLYLRGLDLLNNTA